MSLIVDVDIFYVGLYIRSSSICQQMSQYVSYRDGDSTRVQVEEIDRGLFVP